MKRLGCRTTVYSVVTLPGLVEKFKSQLKKIKSEFFLCNFFFNEKLCLIFYEKVSKYFLNPEPPAAYFGEFKINKSLKKVIISVFEIFPTNTPLRAFRLSSTLIRITSPVASEMNLSGFALFTRCQSVLLFHQAKSRLQ